MMCPKCGKEMRKGYLFGSKVGGSISVEATAVMRAEGS